MVSTRPLGPHFLKKRKLNEEMTALKTNHVWTITNGSEFATSSVKSGEVKQSTASSA